MSLTFNQIVSKLDRRAGTTNGNYPIADKVVDINSAIDDFINLAIAASGKWQVDDTNHSYFPIMYTDLIIGRRDYSFITDEEGTVVLEVEKVMIANAQGIYQEIFAVDQQDIKPDYRVRQMTNELNVKGVPTWYDKTGNTIFLDPVPSYNYTKGLKVYISREGVYFTVSDTTKMPGFPGILHDYFVVNPAYKRRNTKATTRAQIAHVNKLAQELDVLEEKITKYFGRREKDVPKRITAKTDTYE